MKKNWIKVFLIVSLMSLFGCDMLNDTENEVETEIEAEVETPDTSSDSIITDSGITFGDFGATIENYNDDSDWDQIVLDIFGADYRVADWDDLIAYYNAGGDLLALYDGLGLSEYDNSAYVKRSGDPNYSSTRYYFASRHEGSLPTSYSYLSHDEIGGHILSLGSWYGSNNILVVKTNFNATGDNTTTDTGQIYGDFGVTVDTYDDVSDWDQIVSEIFGTDYRVADWDDLIAYYNAGGDLLALYDGLGLTDYDNSAYVKRSGDPNYSSTRYYLASRHEGSLPTSYSYLSHDEIGGHILSLGSWYGSNNILVVKNNFNATGDNTTTDPGKTYGDFGVTLDTYDDVSDWDQIVSDIFGADYRVADWDDLIAYYNAGGDLLALYDGLGLTEYDNSAYVKRSGDPNYSSTRYYFASRHEGSLPTSYSYLSHDEIGGHILSLGSWYGSNNILVVKNSFNSSTTTLPNNRYQGVIAYMDKSGYFTLNLNNNNGAYTLNYEGSQIIGNATIQNGETILIIDEFISSDQVRVVISFNTSGVVLTSEATINGIEAIVVVNKDGSVNNQIWEGTFTGDYSGTWNFLIVDNIVSGVWSNTLGYSGEYSATVSGNLITGDIGSGVINGNTASGNWVLGTGTGSWIGNMK